MIDSPSTGPQPAQPQQPLGNSQGKFVRVPLPRSAPYVTYGIVGVTILVFVLQLLSIALHQGRYSQGMDLLEIYGALVGSKVRQGEIWRLLTPMLLHDNFSLFHILFNMYALFSLGQGLERYFGHGRFFLLYLLGGFAGNVLSFLISSQSYTYSIGASTAIFGLIGAEGVFFYQNRKLFGSEARRAIGNVIFVIVINLFIIGSLPFIDNWGHIGGLIGGLMFTSFAGPLWRVDASMTGYSLVDRRPARDVIVGTAVVVFLFGALALWGMLR